MLKNYLFIPLCSAPFLCSSPLFLFLSAPHTFFFFFFFSVSWSAAPFRLLFSSSLLFLFFRCVALYFSAQNTFFSAQTFFSFSAQTFFSPKRFCFSLKLFSVQPKTFFFFSQFSHSSLLLFSTLFFSGSALSFLFQCLLFFFSLALFIQDPMFSLAASHLFYLNKSLFSSNLELNLNNKNQV